MFWTLAFNCNWSNLFTEIIYLSKKYVLIDLSFIKEFIFRTFYFDYGGNVKKNYTKYVININDLFKNFLEKNIQSMSLYGYKAMQTNYLLEFQRYTCYSFYLKKTKSNKKIIINEAQILLNQI